MIGSLPLFHQIAGRPVIVLGEGAAAEPKRRLVKRAGGVVVDNLADGIAKGARLAFVAHEDAARCEADAGRLREAGLLVNVVDRPELCDFTTPSILDRDPVLLAIGTGGASAGLAKQLRLRLEALLPADLGALANRLKAMRGSIRARWPDIGERRRALDRALTMGGPLDPLMEYAAGRVESWLAEKSNAADSKVQRIDLTSPDPDDLTLRQARLLGTADAIVVDPAIPIAILDRARADAVRLTLPHDGPNPRGIVVELRLC